MAPDGHAAFEPQQYFVLRLFAGRAHLRFSIAQKPSRVRPGTMIILCDIHDIPLLSKINFACDYVNELSSAAFTGSPPFLF